MNTENLYLGEIRRVETPTKTIHVDYTILKELANGHYCDVLSIFRKTYQPTYENPGDLYINTDPDYLIPYYEIIPKLQRKPNKSKKELKEELKALRKDFEIDVSQVFVGYIAQATSVTHIPGSGISSLDRFLTSSRKIDYEKIKQSIFLKQKNNTYLDLKTGIEYPTDAFIEGDLLIPEELFKTIYPFNDYLPEEEKNTNMPKRKILRKYENSNKGSELNER